MSNAWLANADPATAWAHFAWNEFAGLADAGRTVAVLPVHGFADHGLGLPLDAEEIVGSAVLRRAVAAVAAGATVRVLPPLRFALAPYPSAFFGVDGDTAHDLVLEIAAGVRDAGFGRLVFFNTSPWSAELVDTASCDARSALGLRTYVVNLGGLGLDFHPAGPHRAAAQAVAARLLGARPAPSPRPADVRDAGFRPGQYRQPPPLAFDPVLDGGALLGAAATRLAGLLAEILAHPRTAGPADGPAAPAPIVAPADEASWPAHRDRYLGALTREELEAIPDKASALVIVPTGAIEQHGPHLPVGVDAILGQAWLRHALPHLPARAPVYVAPPVTYGKSNEHAGFPGTLSVSARTLRRVLRALAGQLAALGFRRLAVLNTHGGNSSVLVYTLRELQTGLGLQAGLLGGHYRADQDPQEAAYGFHAGEWETALMLACAPDLVRMDRAVCEYPARLDDPGELRPEAAAATFSWLTREISLSGVMGDATRATPDKGARWLAEASAALAARIESLLRDR